MGWNRPVERDQESGIRDQGRRKFPFRGLVAGVVVVVSAVIAAWVILSGSGNAPARSTRHKAQGAICEVKPASAPVQKAVEEKVVEKVAKPQRIGEIRDGKMLLPNGEFCKVKGVITSDVSRVMSKRRIFSHPSENVIAGLLTVKPGQNMVGTPHYNGRFTQDFIESLKNPIIPTKEDSEEDRQLKRLVNRAKIELKAAYDRGEDIEQILLSERAECQKLSRYKQELMKMTVQGAKECATPEDVDDFILAANKMLEAKGIAPMENLGPIAKLKLQMKERDSAK